MTVCYYHITYAFHYESTLYSCLNVKELLTQNSLSDSNKIRNQVVVGLNPVAVTCRLTLAMYTICLKEAF